MAIARALAITRMTFSYRFSLGFLFGCRGQSPIPKKSFPKSNEFALADRETEGESEGCEAQLLRIFVRIFVWDYSNDKNL